MPRNPRLSLRATCCARHRVEAQDGHGVAASVTLSSALSVLRPPTSERECVAAVR